MRSSDIPTEDFTEAHKEALELTPENERKQHLPDNIALALVDRLTEKGQIENKDEARRVRDKIRHTIQGIQEEKGLKFLTEPVNRSGFRNAVFHRLAARMTMSDMPASVKKASGEFRLNLPKEE